MPVGEECGYSVEIDERAQVARIVSPPAPGVKPVLVPLTAAQIADLKALRATFDPASRKVVPCGPSAEEMLRAKLAEGMATVVARDGEAAALAALRTVAGSELAAPDTGVR